MECATSFIDAGGLSSSAVCNRSRIRSLSNSLRAGMRAARAALSSAAQCVCGIAGAELPSPSSTGPGFSSRAFVNAPQILSSSCRRKRRFFRTMARPRSLAASDDLLDSTHIAVRTKPQRNVCLRARVRLLFMLAALDECAVIQLGHCLGAAALVCSSRWGRTKPPALRWAFRRREGSGYPRRLPGR
jgi:hypothetical protein